MFRTMAEDKAFCEEILRVFLSDPALTVLESTPQYAGTNPQGRSVILTTNLTDPGEKFENIPDVCVVFISRFDIFQENHSLYHVDRVIRETGKVVDNGFEEVYVNAKVKDGSEVSELMEVFVDDAAYNSKFPVTSGSKRRYKTTEEGQQVMCEIVERLVNENIERMNALTSILIELDRIDDLKRATKDKDFQMQLMIELLPEDM